jgi:hypothetical protein
MHTVAQLKQLRDQLLEELSQIPQYRALKAMERFIGEMSSIYEGSSAPEPKEKEIGAAFPPAVAKKSASETGAAPSPKVAPYLPTHRVA